MDRAVKKPKPKPNKYFRFTRWLPNMTDLGSWGEHFIQKNIRFFIVRNDRPGMPRRYAIWIKGRSVNPNDNFEPLPIPHEVMYESEGR